jgi:preprotein translocase SecE subunit
MSNYFRETREELSHVNWPGRRQVIVSTLIVIAVAAIVALSLGVFDLFFSWLLKLVWN